MGNILRVECDFGFDPPQIKIILLDMSSYSIPKPLYDAIREPLGLPDLICGEG